MMHRTTTIFDSAVETLALNRLLEYDQREPRLVVNFHVLLKSLNARQNFFLVATGLAGTKRYFFARALTRCSKQF